jgi:putative ABC transport system ATP-binding protein
MRGATLLKVEKIKKNFLVGGQTIEVLRGIDLEMVSGDFGIIFGPSGCGKSTLLHTILGMEKPSEGKIYFDGVDLYSLSEDEIVENRKNKIGVVFQQSIWIKSLNVLENVSFPNRLSGMSKNEAENRALEFLKEVKLDAWAHHQPSELSSGQQQRVSLARALTTDPIMIVADEPTGNLDTASGDELMNLLSELNRKKGKTILMVTHDLEYLRYANRLYHIIDGLKVEEGAGIDKVTKRLKTKKGKRLRLNVRDNTYLNMRMNGGGNED